MKLLYFKGFMEKNILNNINMNETELQRVYNYSTYPRDSKLFSDKSLLL